MTNGFLRIASGAPRVKVADVSYNVGKILEMIAKFEKEQVEIAVFPELCLTGYTCGDLFHSSLLLEESRKGLEKLLDYSKNSSVDFIVGLPISDGKEIWNCAAYLQKGSVHIVKKCYLPTYNEFYERRWFAPGFSDHKNEVFESHGAKIGIEICEDLWVPIPPSCEMALGGADVIFNLSASDDLIGKYGYTVDLIRQQSARCICAYAYSSAGGGESSTDLVYSPKTIIAENGKILAENNRWDENDYYVIADVDIEAIRRDRFHTTTFADCANANFITISSELVLNPRLEDVDMNYKLNYRKLDPHPFVPSEDYSLNKRCEEIINIQTAGLVQRLSAIKCRNLVVGVSGGLDSTLALLIAVKAFDKLDLDKNGIIAVTMPGFGTTGRTYRNAVSLINELGAKFIEISISDSVNQHFKDINHDPTVKDVTYENSQARERTQILMDLANKYGGIVLGTGDMSELALGWATYNGDHMSMYGVNVGVPKTLVKYLVGWFATMGESDSLRSTLTDILSTPISPELIPGEQDEIAQKTEDLVGPYELHDFFLYYTLRFGFSPRRILWLAKQAFEGKYNEETIKKWLTVFLKRFFSQQFKRSCLPDGPKIGSVCLSPRGDWRMPSDVMSDAWIASL